MSSQADTITESGNEASRGTFTTGQSWGALRKAWKGYRIAKVQNDNAKMVEYANKIRKIQGELGQTQADFDCLKQ